MNSIDITAMAFKNLWRRKVRTVLTILGVVVGTASIVMMLSIGIGMNESFKQQVSMMGSLNLITVNPYYYPEIDDGGKVGYVEPQRNTLDDKALEKIAQIDGVEAVTPLLYYYLKFVSGKYVAYGQVVGIYADTMEAFDFKLSQGRHLTSEDTNALVFGSSMVYNFYDPSSRGRYWYYGMQEEAAIDVMNDKIVMTFDMSYGEKRPGGGGQPRDIRKRPIEVKVVGLLEQGQSEKDYSAYINIDYLKKLIKANTQTNKMPGRISYGTSNNTESYEQAWVKVTKLEDVERVQKAINQMGYGAYSLTDILRQMLDATKTIRMVLGAIGAVAFFIAAIGIMNTMIMSIYERTKEIGIMKVLGCMLKDIRKLFLLESALIGLLGSILGIGFSYGVSYLMNRADISFLDYGWYYSYGEKAQISVIPLWLTLAAIGFGSVVGILSGAYPAARAMRISALEAIRNE
ncbi:MAG: ABC transporter permease [Clostridiaceae bacterium]|nr:ABC transporter permease [Clostridiaceae bacterium]